MPRGQKRKLHAGKKCYQAGGETQDLQGAQALAEVEKSCPPPSSPHVGVTAHTKSASKLQTTSKVPQRALSTTESKGLSHTRPCKVAKYKIKRKQQSSQTSPSTEKCPRSSLTSTVRLVVNYMMNMCKMKRPILKADVMKMVTNTHKVHIAEILRRASFNLEVLLGVDLKEADSMDSYTLASKMNLPNNGVLTTGRGFPKTGLLMNLLGVIFLKGNCATEESIWEFLNKMKIYDGKKHFIFGEPRKLITQDLVKLKYLEYRQVPNRSPTSYEFLWGPRSHAETSKMKILKFLAKINHIVPSAFQSRYDEALKDEEERSQAAATFGDTTINTK
ncbi:similar to Melanoma-associated antigen B3 (MAGE-B3 antigen) (predicted) [Rattus norvegicus]|uniref:MAGE family member B3 n=2 Tax=Rattus norvegicus TaxID=10116 RepID=A0A8I6AWU5_RAT|nr:melanoma-associated antigen B3 [Rattus norvegicus]EDL96043.1 similar to Melanoma-associated antigen B3 (MAGE-B3 antigen) (predicted) [Rattus norvegicus]|eukprot:NP_001100435.1 melanoma-associated antigen B3 [Rattus norvegicus]